MSWICCQKLSDSRVGMHCYQPLEQQSQWQFPRLHHQLIGFSNLAISSYKSLTVMKKLTWSGSCEANLRLIGKKRVNIRACVRGTRWWEDRTSGRACETRGLKRRRTRLSRSSLPESRFSAVKNCKNDESASDQFHGRVRLRD